MRSSHRFQAKKDMSQAGRTEKNVALCFAADTFWPAVRGQVQQESTRIPSHVWFNPHLSSLSKSINSARALPILHDRQKRSICPTNRSYATFELLKGRLFNAITVEADVKAE